MHCSKPVGCTDKTAYNYDVNAAVANASCRYPSLFLSFDLVVDSLRFEINRIYTVGGLATAFKQFQFYASSFCVQKQSGDSLYFPSKYPLIKERQQYVFFAETGLDSLLNITFDVGLPPAINNQIGTFLNNPEHPLSLQVPDTMHLNYDDGYIFLKMQGKVDRNGDGIPNEHESFDLRIGTNALLRTIRLNLKTKVQGPKDTIHIRLDIAKLLQGLDLSSEAFTQSTDNIELATKIANNMEAAFSAP